MPDTGNWAENDQFVSQMVQAITGVSVGRQSNSTTPSPGVTAPTPPHRPRWGTSLSSPRTELGITSHRPPPTQHVHSAQRKHKPEPWGSHQMGTNNTCVWDQHILAAPKPHWRPRGLLMPFGRITWLHGYFCKCQGERGGYLVFAGAGRICCHSSSRGAQLRGQG